ALGVSATLGIDQLLGRDPEEPGAGVAGVGAVAPAAGQGRREGLRREIGRQLGVVRAPHEVAERPFGVAAIEELEGRAVAGGQQILVAADLGTHASTYFEPRPVVVTRPRYSPPPCPRTPRRSSTGPSAPSSTRCRHSR